MMKFSYFSADGSEYIIKNRTTPSHWINYIYNNQYFTSVSNDAGGISYLNTPLHGLITRCVPGKRGNGARFRVRIQNPQGIESGVQTVEMIGSSISVNILPICPSVTCHVVATEG